MKPWSWTHMQYNLMMVLKVVHKMCFETITKLFWYVCEFVMYYSLTDGVFICKRNANCATMYKTFFVEAIQMSVTYKKNSSSSTFMNDKRNTTPALILIYYVNIFLITSWKITSCKQQWRFYLIKLNVNKNKLEII